MKEIRKIPDVVMDIMKYYGLTDGGEKPLLDYLDEIIAAYGEMEKDFYQLTKWQMDMEKTMREMKIAMKQLKKIHDKEMAIEDIGIDDE